MPLSSICQLLDFGFCTALPLQAQMCVCISQAHASPTGAASTVAMAAACPPPMVSTDDCGPLAPARPSISQTQHRRWAPCGDDAASSAVQL